jgi:hypothetical protein
VQLRRAVTAHNAGSAARLLSGRRGSKRRGLLDRAVTFRPRTAFGNRAWACSTPGEGNQAIRGSGAASTIASTSPPATRREKRSARMSSRISCCPRATRPDHRATRRAFSSAAALTTGERVGVTPKDNAGQTNFVSGSDSVPLNAGVQLGTTGIGKGLVSEALSTALSRAQVEKAQLATNASNLENLFSSAPSWEAVDWAG